MVFLGIWDMDGITLEIICHQLIHIDMITCYVDIGIPGCSEDASWGMMMVLSMVLVACKKRLKGTEKKVNAYYIHNTDHFSEVATAKEKRA